jgi:NADH-quinone oxidoreductase subunit G
MPDLVTLTIDEKKVTVPAGTLVVDAARSVGIDIPVFCSHAKLDPLGACRMCLVEFIGPRGTRLDTSCTVRVSEGMVVRTDSEQVKAVRKAILAFILINHPLDCPICDKGGECPLQDQTMEYGPGASQFIEPKVRKQKDYPISNLIVLDQERCILCWRCVRYLQEWEDKPQLGLFERGGQTKIDVFPGQPVDAKTSGSIIDLCPVGALTNAVARFRYRPWEIRRTPSICTLCPVGCSLRLDERSHELRRIVARVNMAVNDEWICDKGRFLHQYVDHPGRLKAPMIRDEATGELRETSWEDALGRVAYELQNQAQCSGAWAVGGVASARVSNEAIYLFQKLFRVFIRTNNVDFPTGSAVHALPTGLPAIGDIAKSDLIALVGFDPSEAAPLLDLHIKRAILRGGAKLVVINSRQIELARYADGAFLAAYPGSESVVLNGLSATILRGARAASGTRAVSSTQSRSSGGTAQGASARPAGRSGSSLPASGLDEWSAIRGLTPKKVADSTGLAAESLQTAATLLAEARNPLFIYGAGVAAGARGRATVTALNNLAILLGYGDRVAHVGAEANSQGARDMGLLPDMLPGHLSVKDGAVRERLGKLWGVEPPSEPGQSYREMLDGGVQALYVMGDNPAADPSTAERLLDLNFLVVQDLFLTETAKLADVVLPSASFAEGDGTYTNLERRVQRAPKGIRAAGDSRADWAILTALAGRFAQAALSVDLPAPDAVSEKADWKSAKKARRAKQGPVPKPWNYPKAHVVLEEIGRAVPIYADLRWEALGESGLQWSAQAAGRTARRVETAEVVPDVDLPPGSLWLVSGPLLWDGGVLMRHAADEVRRLIPEPFVALNPVDLARIGLAEGGMVTVSSARATVNVALKADTTVHPGTAWVPAMLTGAPAEVLRGGLEEPVPVTIQLSAPASQNPPDPAPVSGTGTAPSPQDEENHGLD